MTSQPLCRLCLTVLILLASAGAATPQSAGRAPEPGAQASGGATYLDNENRVTTSGVLRFWRAHSSGGGRVMLKVFRPEGSRLVLVGTSALETAPAGETITFGCEIPVSRNDLIGCYCPDAHCIDRFAEGSTRTIVGDAGTTASALFLEEAGTPALFASTTRSLDVPSPAGRDLVVPVVARTAGLGGTTWSTSIELFNTADEESLIALYFNLSGEDNTLPAASAQVRLPARGTATFDDLLMDAFGMAHASGSVDIVSPHPVIAHARIANQGDAAGGYGQVVPAVPVAWALGDDDMAGANPNSDIYYLFEVREDGAFRTNVGIANVSGVPLSVDLEAFVGTTRTGDTLRVDLQPYSHLLLVQVLETMGVPFGTPGVRLNVSAAAGSSGRFLAYASRVDNTSGDGSFFLGVRERPLP